MDSSRLLEVLDDVDNDLEGGLVRLLSVVVQQYTTARDSPTVDNAPAIHVAYTSLVEHINKSIFSEYPPSKVGILKAIGGDTRVGPGLKEKLDTLLSMPERTAAGLVTALNAVVSEINTFKKSVTQVRAGLKALGFTPHSIAEGDFEVGVLIPETLVDKELSSLIKELDVWNKIVRAFQEVAGEEEREVTLTGLSSGSYETYIQIGVIAATYLSLTIDKVFEWYQKILEIRKLRQALKDLGAPTSETNAIQKHEKEVVDNGINALVKDILKQASSKLDSNRKHELETHLTISIKQITRFVDSGGNVEVTTAAPEAPEEPVEVAGTTSDEKEKYDQLVAEHKKLQVQIDKLMAINRAGSSLRRLPPRTEPILQLDFDMGEEEKSEKQPKKKTEKSAT